MLKMNNLSNSSDPTFLLSSSQVTLYTDKLILYFIVLMAMLGTLFNAVSFGIYCQKSFSGIALFKYMRVYTLASLFVSSCLMFSFYLASYSLYQVAITYSARIFSCKVLQSYVMALFFFYENVLDILKNIERAAVFSFGFTRFKKISPYVISFVLFIVCGVIHAPNYFLFDITQDDELPKVLRDCKPTQFIQKPVGKLLLIICYALEGPAVMILVLITNVIAMISFQRFMKRKADLLAQTAHTSRRNEIENNTEKSEKIDTDLIKMTFYLSLFSVVTLLVQFTSQLIMIVFQMSTELSAWFLFMYLFVTTFKNFSNIFYFYKYNSQFRSSFLKLVGRKQTNMEAEENLQQIQKNILKITQLQKEIFSIE